MADLLHGLNFHIPAMSSTEQTRILHTAVQLQYLTSDNWRDNLFTLTMHLYMNIKTPASAFHTPKPMQYK